MAGGDRLTAGVAARSAPPSRVPYVVLLGATGTLVGSYRAMRPFCEGSDDLAYARLAHDVVAGTFALHASPLEHRFGVFLPTAATYALLGVSDYSTTLWPLVAAAITLTLAVSVAQRLAGATAAAVAAVLLVFDPLVLGQTVVLMPDLILGMFSFVAVTCLLAARQAARPRMRRVGAAAFVASVTAALLTKETGVWLVYFMVAVLIADAIAGRHGDVWRWILGGGALASAAFFAAYHVATGDALLRVRVIDQAHNLGPWGYDPTRPDWAGPLDERLTTGPLDLLSSERGLLLPLALALPTVAYPGEDPRAAGAAARYFTLYALAVIVSFCFGTTSLRVYNPLPLYARMLVPAVPALVVSAALVVTRLCFDDRTSARCRLTLGLLPAAVLLGGALYSNVRSGSAPAPYLACAALLASAVPSRGGASERVMRAWRRAAGVLLVLVAAYVGGGRVARGELGERPAQAAERRLIEHLLTSLPAGSTVVASERSASLIEYHNGFLPVTAPALIAWRGVPPEATARASRFVYWNDYREPWIADTYGDESFVSFVRSRRAGWRVVRRAGVATLYEIPEGG